MGAHLQLPDWSRPFLAPARYKCAYGGRSSSKTWTFAHLIVLMGAQKRMRIACCRAVQDSIRQSTKQTLEVAIHRAGLGNFYEISQQEIRGANGTVIFFSGLEGKRESIRGWEAVDLVWVDEAHAMSHETAIILIPTLRKAGHELWFTFNPKLRTDWVWQRFTTQRRDSDVVAHVNYFDNPWCPEGAIEEAEWCQRDNPGQYAHIWLGEPDDEGGERPVLAYATLLRCVEAFRQGLHNQATTGKVNDLGLDIANGGADKNAVVVRHGPTIHKVDRFASLIVDDLRPTAERAHSHAAESGCKRVWYDANGIGGGMGGELTRIDRSQRFARRRVLAGERPKGEEVEYSYRTTNREQFFNRYAQQAWALRLRAMNTVRLLNGRPVKASDCLFIDPACVDGVPGLTLDEYLGQLSQPIWEETPTSRVRVKKRDEEEPSPDMFDATAMAFGKDSEYGLVLRLPPGEVA